MGLASRAWGGAASQLVPDQTADRRADRRAGQRAGQASTDFFNAGLAAGAAAGAAAGTGDGGAATFRAGTAYHAPAGITEGGKASTHNVGLARPNRHRVWGRSVRPLFLISYFFLFRHQSAMCRPALFNKESP